MNIVFSRPIWSDTQPKNGRVRPFSTRSIDSAKVSAGRVMPSRLTGTSATLKSLAIGASCAVAIRPPAPTSTNIRYITQKIGVLQHLDGRVVRARIAARGVEAGTCAGRGRAQQPAQAAKTTTPWPRPNQKKVAS